MISPSDEDYQATKLIKATAYVDLIRPHDEFGYFAGKEDFPVAFDSKEVFDREYNGSWFYYDRNH